MCVVFVCLFSIEISLGEALSLYTQFHTNRAAQRTPLSFAQYYIIIQQKRLTVVLLFYRQAAILYCTLGKTVGESILFIAFTLFGRFISQNKLLYIQFTTLKLNVYKCMEFDVFKKIYIYVLGSYYGGQVSLRS